MRRWVLIVVLASAATLAMAAVAQAEPVAQAVE